LDRSFGLDIITKGDIVDVCVDQRRTLIARRKGLRGAGLAFLVDEGEVRFDEIQLRPLR